MIDIAWTLALHMAGLLLFAAILRLLAHSIAITPLISAVGVTVVYWAVEVFGSAAQPHVPGFTHLHWNWFGKVLAVIVSLAMVAALPRMTRNEVGLTCRQKAGWLFPVLLVMLATCAVSWIAQELSHEGRQLAPERLLFQATMPGLDEELFFRGVLLALLARAFGPSREVASAPFGAAEIAVILLFAAAHGIRIAHGAIAFSASDFVVTGLIGSGLTWLRTRTGSLAITVLAHNLVNLGNSFF